MISLVSWITHTDDQERCSGSAFVLFTSSTGNVNWDESESANWLRPLSSFVYLTELSRIMLPLNRVISH